MLLSKILTIVNLLGAIASFISLAITIKRYQIAPKMQVYMFLSFTSMVLLMWTQLYIIAYRMDIIRWIVKLATTFWWIKTLYFSWAVRFSSLKKT